ncbi:MAG: hypothetical protein KKA05_06555, partial [Alphaproteobacteria bacterium]|nr:hypothetical protein [Alphaproteobacteria bacterium]
MVATLARDFNVQVQASPLGGVRTQEQLLKDRLAASNGQANQFSDIADERGRDSEDKREREGRELFRSSTAMLNAQIANIDAQIENLNIDLGTLAKELAALEERMDAIRKEDSDLESGIEKRTAALAENAERRTEVTAGIAAADDIIAVDAAENARRAKSLQGQDVETVVVPGHGTAVLAITVDPQTGTSALTAVDPQTGAIVADATDLSLRDQALHADAIANPDAAAAAAVAPVVEGSTHTPAAVEAAAAEREAYFVELGELDKAREILQTEVTQMTRQRIMLERELRDLKSQHGETSAEYTAKQAEIAELQERRATLVSARDGLDPEVSEMGRNNLALAQELASLGEQHGTTSEEYITKAAELAALEAQRAELMEARASLLDPDVAHATILEQMQALELDGAWNNAIRPENESYLSYTTEGIQRTATEIKDGYIRLKELREDPEANADAITELREELRVLREESAHYNDLHDRLMAGEAVGGPELDQEIAASAYSNTWGSFSTQYASVMEGLSAVGTAVASVVESTGIGSVISAAGSAIT